VKRPADFAILISIDIKEADKPHRVIADFFYELLDNLATPSVVLSPFLHK
jgi:hypothetical protein